MINLCLVQRFITIFGRDHLIAFPLQVVLQDFQYIRLIVSNKNFPGPVIHAFYLGKPTGKAIYCRRTRKAFKRLNEKLIEQPNFAPSLQRKPGVAGLYKASNA
jgi:hypothetical protein